MEITAVKHISFPIDSQLDYFLTISHGLSYNEKLKSGDDSSLIQLNMRSDRFYLINKA